MASFFAGFGHYGIYYSIVVCFLCVFEVEVGGELAVKSSEGLKRGVV